MGRLSRDPVTLSPLGTGQVTRVKADTLDIRFGEAKDQRGRRRGSGSNADASEAKANAEAEAEESKWYRAPVEGIEVNDTVDMWWTAVKDSSRSIDARLEEFIEQLQHCSAERIVVVGHSLFFRRLLRDFQCRDDPAAPICADEELSFDIGHYKLPNCGVVALTMDFDREPRQCITDAHLMFGTTMQYTSLEDHDSFIGSAASAAGAVGSGLTSAAHATGAGLTSAAHATGAGLVSAAEGGKRLYAEILGWGGRKR